MWASGRMLAGMHESNKGLGYEQKYFNSKDNEKNVCSLTDLGRNLYVLKRERVSDRI